MRKILWYISNLRPSQVKKLFKAIHNYENDPCTEGLRRAIYYGRLHFEHDSYTNGQFDKKKRAKRVDEIIKEYTHPASIVEFIDLLKKTKAGVIEANTLGFVVTPKPTKLIPDATSPDGYKVVVDEETKKKEANYYTMAIDGLNLIRLATIIYPRLWRSTFLAQS